MEFRVEKIDGKYTILDQDGTIYGRYDIKEDALIARLGWIEYYQQEAP
jgi:hypothetical protein